MASPRCRHLWLLHAKPGLPLAVSRENELSRAERTRLARHGWALTNPPRQIIS